MASGCRILTLGLLNSKIRIELQSNLSKPMREASPAQGGQLWVSDHRGTRASGSRKTNPSNQYPSSLFLSSASFFSPAHILPSPHFLYRCMSHSLLLASAPLPIFSPSMHVTISLALYLAAPLNCSSLSPPQSHVFNYFVHSLMYRPSPM